MFFNSEQTTTLMGQLFEEARQYFRLQKEYLSLHGTEIMSRLFSTIALWVILILVGFMVLLFGSFALAYWIGDILGSSVLGFAIIAAVLFLGAMLVYVNRVSWIVAPTTRFMVSLFVSNLIVPSQEAIAIEKEHVRQNLEDSQQDLKTTASSILAPLPQPQNKWESFSNLFQHGLTLFRGIQIGMSAIAAARTLFKIGKSKKR